MVCCFIFLILYCEVCRKRIVEESLYFRYASEPFLNKLWCCDKKNAGNLELQDFWRLRAGDERIELPPKVLETPIIPFDQSPMFCFCCNYTYKRNSCQGKINKNCTKSTIKRRWRDLNPRTSCPAYRISSADPSATWVHLHDIFHYIGVAGKGQCFFCYWRKMNSVISYTE